MFYEVRILDKNGNVKKVLSSKDLSRHYWKVFEDHSHAGPKKGRKIAKKSKEGDMASNAPPLDPTLFDDYES